MVGEFLDSTMALLRESGVPGALQESGALHYLGRVVEAQAWTHVFQDGFTFLSAVFVGALVPVWILHRTTRVRGS